MTKPYLRIIDDAVGELTFTHGAGGAVAFSVVSGGHRLGGVIPENHARTLAAWLGTMYPPEDGSQPAPEPDPQAVDPAFSDRLRAVSSHGEGFVQAHREWGEFINAGSDHVCPHCGTVTVYQTFSGGREWACPGCEAEGEYPGGVAPSRAGLLATPEGRRELREQMRGELDRLGGAGAGGVQEAE